MHFVASGLLIFPHTGHLIGWLRFAAPGLKHISVLSPEKRGHAACMPPAMVYSKAMSPKPTSFSLVLTSIVFVFPSYATVKTKSASGRFFSQKSP